MIGLQPDRDRSSDPISVNHGHWDALADTREMKEQLLADSGKLRGVVKRVQSGLIDRDSLVETMVLAAVAGEHVLVVGPPGTAKSEAVRRVAAELGGSYFEYLLGRFTEPNEVFGPVDLKRLRDGVVEIETAGMLPEAEVAFLDEVFLGSTAILNTLLGILNERTFRRGSTVMSCPLRLCVGATNTLPDDISLSAFADRFLVRVFVDAVPDHSLEEMLEAGWRSASPKPPRPVGIDVIERMASSRSACDLTQVRPLIGAGVRRMRSAGIQLSDRRAVRSQNLVAAAAVLDGRLEATAADLWPLPLIVPTAEAQPVARDALAELLETSENRSLPSAAEELSAGPIARARGLVIAANGLRVDGDDTVGGDTLLRIEAVLREIDAGFESGDMPDDLSAARADLVARLEANQ